MLPKVYINSKPIVGGKDGIFPCAFKKECSNARNLGAEILIKFGDAKAVLVVENLEIKLLFSLNQLSSPSTQMSSRRASTAFTACINTKGSSEATYTPPMLSRLIIKFTESIFPVRSDKILEDVLLLTFRLKIVLMPSSRALAANTRACRESWPASP